MASRNQAKCLILCSSRASKDASGIAESERVPLARFVPYVTGVEVALKTSAHGHTLKHLHAVRCIRLDEERLWVGQEVVDHIALGDHAHVLDGIDVVVCRSNTQRGLHDAISGKHKLFRDDQLQTLNSDLQTTFIGERCNVDQGLLKRGFRKISRRGELVLEVWSTQSRMIQRTQGLAVATE